VNLRPILLGVGAAVVVPLFLSGSGHAHTVGMSVAEFDVAPEGRVDARLTFASAEPLGSAARLSEADLRTFVMQGVDVTADGARCEGTYRGASITEVDGLRLDASYDCPAGAAAIEATLYYLSALPPGHREVARIVGPPGSQAVVEAVLTGDRRALRLELPGGAFDDRRTRLGRRVTALAAIFAALMGTLFAWRWRATRGRHRPTIARRD
jgi:hypothetical protein